jgi:putative transposase
MRLRELAASRVRFGYRPLTVLLRREGWKVNAKRIYRLYTDDGLAVRTKLRRKIGRRHRWSAVPWLAKQTYYRNWLARLLLDFFNSS